MATKSVGVSPRQCKPGKTLIDRTAPCSVDGCDKLVISSRGWCSMHYQRWLRTGDHTHSRMDRDQTGKPCKADGCERKSGYKGYCQMHFLRVKQFGDPQIVSGNGQRGRCERWISIYSAYEGDDCLAWPYAAGENGRSMVAWRGKNTTAPRAMCIAAHGEPPTDKHQAAHSCGNGHTGCLNPRHLRWATPQENEADKILHGTIRRGDKINTAKLDCHKVREIRKIGRSVPPVDLAERYGVTKSCISQIILRRSWAWLD